MDYTSELRATSFHVACDVCGKVAAPQLMRAILTREHEQDTWRVVGWEHIKCGGDVPVWPEFGTVPSDLEAEDLVGDDAPDGVLDAIQWEIEGGSEWWL